MKKLAFALGGIAVLAAAGWYAFGRDAAPADTLEVVRFVHTSGQFSVNFPIFVGRETGIFAAHGLDVRGEEVEGGVAVAALLSGSVDYMAFPSQATPAWLQGAPIRMVSTLSEISFQYLVAKAGLAPAEIRSIGIPRKHVSPHQFTLAAMEKYGIDAELKETLTPSALRAEMLRGNLDAAVVGYLAPVDFETGGFVVLDRFEDDPGSILTIQALERTIREKPDQVQRVVDAFRGVAQYIRDNPAETREMLYEYYGFTERTETEVRKVEEGYAAASAFFSPSGALSKAGVRRLIQVAKAGEYETLADIERQDVSEEEIANLITPQFVDIHD